MSIAGKITSQDWDAIRDELHVKGYAVVQQLLNPVACGELIANYNQADLYRKTISMERYNFGFGEYKYYNYPLPPVVQELREGIYPELAPVANKWMEVLNIGTPFPATLDELKELCHAHQQIRPTPLILQYHQGGYNTLHQDLYGDVFFPIQLVAFLDEGYQGGEFVLVEQRPRAQSKAIVLKPGKGDLLIFTTNFRPVKGSRGYYRVNMKHGVSEVKAGMRHTLGVIFHDAL